MKNCVASSLAVFVLLLGGLAAMANRPASQDSGDWRAVVKGDNAFAGELYARLGQREGNLFFSPYSISTALAMTYAGARDQTAQEIATTLHFTLPQDRLPAGYAALSQKLAGSEKRNSELHIANALWGQK